MKSMSRILLGLLGLVMLSSFIFACKKQVVKKEEPKTVFAVLTTTAVRGELNDYIRLNGDVSTKSSIDVYADTAGKVVSLNVSVGSRVGAGDVIARVDASKPGSNFIANPVRAPIAGTITNIPIAVGSSIGPGVAVARIGTTGNIQIRSLVAERFISRMKVGLQSLIMFDAFPGEKFKAVITEISPVVDPNTRTLEVKLALQPPDPRVRAGMFGEIRIITDPKTQIIKIPSATVIRNYDKTYVFVIKKNGSDTTVEKRAVVQGIAIDDKTEILSGLNEGEEIVAQGMELLDDKSLVKIVGTVPPLENTDVIGTGE